MGCPAGIGPEIILKYFVCSAAPSVPAVVAGDTNVLKYYAAKLNISCTFTPWNPGDTLPRDNKTIPVYETSRLTQKIIQPGIFSKETSVAMVEAITHSVKGIQQGVFSGICTCPISKEALQLSGQHFPGHTEMLAELCCVKSQVMMMAGKTLRVTLATIHCAVKEVPALLQVDSLVDLFRTTYTSLQVDFNLSKPKVAVAALNPHASENGMFGNEEECIILPAIKKAENMDIPLQGPFPPDTLFFKAARGQYDAVICMYHDQGLIPFKLLHFDDGVNVTLGLPIVRTSVDHGTAYDIAGQGKASPNSLQAAIAMAHTISTNRNKA
ncbi:MAG: 4-hydroxythreonine-4-phosphate dehydrogenase PdxA [Desulfocapsa sp.]|nr:MAG: 4-hydroxythreonine-4-phosphate dehydrogenase PdxA [Desulfocapsa sp.]